MGASLVFTIVLLVSVLVSEPFNQSFISTAVSIIQSDLVMLTGAGAVLTIATFALVLRYRSTV
jgi:hypothetical protein